MARNDPQVNLRMPANLKDQLDNAAGENKRSLTAEITARLDESFQLEERRQALKRERDFVESAWRRTELELVTAKAALAEQKKLTGQLQALLAESHRDAQQRQGAEEAIAARYSELKQQYDLLEGLKEELAHLSEARGDSPSTTATLLKQQAELIEQLRINQTLNEQTIMVFRDAFLDAASGDGSAFARLLDTFKKVGKKKKG